MWLANAQPMASMSRRSFESCPQPRPRVQWPCPARFSTQAARKNGKLDSLNRLSPFVFCATRFVGCWIGELSLLRVIGKVVALSLHYSSLRSKLGETWYQRKHGLLDWKKLHCFRQQDPIRKG